MDKKSQCKNFLSSVCPNNCDWCDCDYFAEKFDFEFELEEAYD